VHIDQNILSSSVQPLFARKKRFPVSPYQCLPQFLCSSNKMVNFHDTANGYHDTMGQPTYVLNLVA
jgi:hypothetical protein